MEQKIFISVEYVMNESQEVKSFKQVSVKLI